MRKNATVFDGELVVLPLSGFIRHGKGDDVVVTIDHENDSEFGHLGFGNNRKVYKAACELAALFDMKEPDEEGSEAEEPKKRVPLMIALVDPETGVRKVLTREVIRDGKKHHLAIIFNAEFSCPDETRDGSFCLRMSERIDPKRVFSERIMYNPGKRIVWEPNQLAMLDR